MYLEILTKLRHCLKVKAVNGYKITINVLIKVSYIVCTKVMPLLYGSLGIAQAALML